MAKKKMRQLDKATIGNRVREAATVLDSVGLPLGQQNERSALCLLALLNLRPDATWASASNPLIGITPLMTFIAAHYRKRPYKPNTRETIRDETIAFFVAAGLVAPNPDKPDRPKNSPKWCYQVDAGALELMRAFGGTRWEKSLASYLATVQTLRERYARERQMQRLPVHLEGGHTLTLSPGGQNILIKAVLEEFCPRFTPGAKLIYVGDADDKWVYLEAELLAGIGVHLIETHGAMPDVIVYDVTRGWLVLIEAVTSNGPVDARRHDELRRLFAASAAGLVFVTAFLERRALGRFLSEISWETEVWVADAPTHLIHFDGERFLGPY